ncbi:alcohol oxidase [Auricularia subglabra TFB-10046 SS5]|nr:alcohol oxidase [Auricularia subglabra TFB-10046 SS5]
MPILPPAVQDVDELLARDFDYVVAGGGTGGLALAALLSDDPDVSVLVLDKGVHRPDDLNVVAPQLWVNQLGRPEYDHGYLSVPQASSNGKRIYFSASKTLGGTSTMNALTYIQMARNELQAWVELGNATWDWETFLRHTNETESFTFADNDLPSTPVPVARPLHVGSTGPISLAFSTFFSTLLPIWHEALRRVGINSNRDPRATGTNAGAWTVQNTITSKNERADAVHSYYLPRAARPNLVVVTGAQVNRVTLSPTANESGLYTATGVVFEYQGIERTVRACREVIISAGTFVSARILELSGIGNPAVLDAAGIACVIDLPGVGENFQDHWAWNYGFHVKDAYTTLDHLRDPTVSEAHMEQYVQSRTGLLTSGQTSLVYITAKDLFDEDTVVAMQNSLDEDIENAAPGMKEQYIIMKKWLGEDGVPFVEMFPQFQAFYFPGEPRAPEEKYLALCTFLTHPFSRGSVHITSADPNDPVAIDPRLYSHPLDKTFALAAVQFAREKLAKTEPLASALDGPAHPPANASPEDLEALVTDVITGHAIGTCSMLPRDKGGVVDDQLKVWGTTNLRVVDASVFPLHTSNHPQATIYAAAHKVLADIRKQLGDKAV